MTNTAKRHQVWVSEPNEPIPEGWKGCEIGSNLIFSLKNLEAHCFAVSDAMALDVFTVMSAIRFCDHTKRRPASDWKRCIAVNIPVYEADRWKSESVSRALHRALQLITGDYWQVSFRARDWTGLPLTQQSIEFPDTFGAVMAYSGGLDSVATAFLEKPNHPRGILRANIGRRIGSDTFWKDGKGFNVSVPFKVNCGNRGPDESSSRTRSFVHSLLCGVAAFYTKAETIIMTESGQSIWGPSLVLAGQAYEDFRSHPVFTKYMEKLIAGLFEHEVRFAFPRIWHTKGETLNEFLEAGGCRAALLDTRSCWRDARHASVSGRRRQCGICAACLLRRMSLYSIGCSDQDREYLWENLRATEFQHGRAVDAALKGLMDSYCKDAVAGTMMLTRFAALGISEPNNPNLKRHAFELSKMLELPAGEVMQKMNRMLRRHAKEWNDFVESLGPEAFVAQWSSGG